MQHTCDVVTDICFALCRCIIIIVMRIGYSHRHARPRTCQLIYQRISAGLSETLRSSPQCTRPPCICAALKAPAPRRRRQLLVAPTSIRVRLELWHCKTNSACIAHTTKGVGVLSLEEPLVSNGIRKLEVTKALI